MQIFVLYERVYDKGVHAGPPMGVYSSLEKAQEAAAHDISNTYPAIPFMQSQHDDLYAVIYKDKTTDARVIYVIVPFTLDALPPQADRMMCS